MRIKPNVTTAALLGVLLGTALLVSACSTGNFADSVARASKYFDNGKFRSATITLKNVLQDEPNNAQAWFVLGRVSLVQGQYAEATHQFRRARDIGTSHQQVDRLLAKALLGNGSFKKALDVLSRNESDEGKARAQDYVLRGRAYLGLGKLQQAKQAFDTALQARPDYPAALVGQARVAWHTGNAARAQKLLTRVTKANPTYGRAWMVAGNMAYNRQDCGDVIDVFKHIRSLDARALPPGQVFNARGHAAFCQLRQGKLDNAAANIDVLLKRGPENPYANYLKGLLAYLNKNYDKATAHVQKALAKVPNNLSGLVLSGMIKTAQGDLKGAQVQFTNAVKQAPDSVRARQLLASVYMRRGLPKQAVKVLQQALDQQATNAQVLAQLGQAAVRAGQRAKGLHYLQRSAHYSAGNSGMQVAVARHMAQAGDVDSALALLKQVGTGQGNKALKFALFKISLYVQNEQPGKAIGEAQSLVKKHPDKVWFVRLLARVYATVGQNANARRTLKDALQVNPNNASIHLDLGRLAMLEGDYRSANSIFQAVVDTHPANVSAVLALARSAVRLGHKERATSLVEKAAQLRPDSIGIRKTLTRAYLAQERPDDALRVVDSLIADAPDSARLHWLKSEVLVAAGQQKAALASLKKAVALAPDMLGLRFELAHMLFAQQQFISATSQLRKIREQRPAFVPAAVLLARVQLRQGQLQAALATADSLRASGKNIAASYTLRGELLQAQERYKKQRRRMPRPTPSNQIANWRYVCSRYAGKGNCHIRKSHCRHGWHDTRTMQRFWQHSPTGIR